jgi:hypothetical protein
MEQFSVLIPKRTRQLEFSVSFHKQINQFVNKIIDYVAVRVCIQETRDD